ncbi:hypothetical protein AVEN_133546-1 [Araneus ventricosus]|uniref:Uncharacterized protein n=1 Tax=Araneus ventricosus TaxID=182803 RepID=A0A4Y2MHQ7_ARAVE|nr:hypothetical protein AVEN_133546-1 [Araneus ventricosus]
MAKSPPLSEGERSYPHLVKSQETNPPCIFRGDRNMCQENVAHDCDITEVSDTSATIFINAALKIKGIITKDCYAVGRIKIKRERIKHHRFEKLRKISSSE